MESYRCQAFCASKWWYAVFRLLFAHLHWKGGSCPWIARSLFRIWAFRRWRKYSAVMAFMVKEQDYQCIDAVFLRILDMCTGLLDTLRRPSWRMWAQCTLNSCFHCVSEAQSRTQILMPGCISWKVEYESSWTQWSVCLKANVSGECLRWDSISSITYMMIWRNL